MRMIPAAILAAVAVASIGANAAHATQKHDPQFQNARVPCAMVPDPDLIHQFSYQGGSPRAKADLYVAHPTTSGMERDLAREIRYQNGSPKSKSNQVFYLAPLK